MTRRIVFVIAVLGVLVGTAVGCERNPSLRTTESTGSDAPEGTPLIDYHATGGVAGTDVRLVIFEDGAAEATINRNPVRRFEIEERELEQVRSLLAGGKWGNVTSVNDGVVIADGYRYVMIFRGQRVSAADPDVRRGWPRSLR
jgi:hypothetical protein